MTAGSAAVSEETCVECPRRAKWRLTIWRPETDSTEDCGVRCGIHARKYGRLGFHRCRLHPAVISIRIGPIRWYSPVAS